MIKNAKFHHLGTKHKTYIKRLELKYTNIKYFEYCVISSRRIEIYANNKIIDVFTSKSTFNQFILVLEAFNMIENIGSKYKVILNHFDVDHITKAIFEKSVSTKIQNYRISRQISLLESLNLIRKDNIDECVISKYKGRVSIKDIKSEASI
jgi:hypothetical protein